MARMSVLITREAREQRSLLILALVVLPIGTEILSAAYLRDRRPDYGTIALLVIPVFLCLMLWALLLESLTRDAHSDTGESLARLPLAPIEVFAAKAIWMTCVTIVLGCWCYVTEAIFALKGGSISACVALGEFGKDQVELAWTAFLITALVVVMGSWFRRSFVAVGGIALALAVLAALRLNFRHEILSLPLVWPMELTLAVPVLGLLAGGAAVFRTGALLPMEWFGRSVRLIAIGSLGFSAVAGAQWARADAVRHSRIESASLGNAAVSPDGRLISTHAHMSYPTTFGFNGGHLELWILDSRSGERIRTIQIERNQPEALQRPWLPDGDLLVWRSHNGGSIYSVDPWTGDETNVNSLALSDGGVRLHNQTQYIRTASSGPVRSGLRAPGKERIQVGVEDDRSYSLQEDGRVLRHEYPENSTTEIYRMVTERGVPVRYPQISPDGLWLLLNYQDAPRGDIIDATTGQLVGQVPDGWVFENWTGCADPVATATQRGPLSNGPTSRMLLGPDGSRLVALPGPGWLFSLGDGSLLFEGGPSLYVLDCDGGYLHTLYEPQAVAQ
ncbi:MAG: hypothetical protein ACI8QC_004255 [Planctomycetota bacterium]|jgi:hypothetical protein